MPWPKDPARYAAAKERHREAQRRRWERPEERERARQNAYRQFADPAARRLISERHKEAFRNDPSIARRISEALTGRTWPNRKPPIKRAEARKLAEAKAERKRVIAKRAAELRTDTVH